MTTSTFCTSYNSISKILKELDLFRMKGIKTLYKDGVSDIFKKASISDNYFEVYKKGLENNDFDFLLKDESFFQFEFVSTNKYLEVRYAFFQNPIDYISYESYVNNFIIEHSMTETVNEIGSIFQEEYEQFLSEQELKSKYLTIRYDVDYPNYKPNVHSVSHLHIGHQNDLRIPIEKFITPVSFVIFIIKNVYYKEWKQIIKDNPHYIYKVLKDCKNGELVVPNKYWNNFEKLELYIK